MPAPTRAPPPPQSLRPGPSQSPQGGLQSRSLLRMIPKHDFIDFYGCEESHYLTRLPQGPEKLACYLSQLKINEHIWEGIQNLKNYDKWK